MNEDMENNEANESFTTNEFSNLEKESSSLYSLRPRKKLFHYNIRGHKAYVPKPNKYLKHVNKNLKEKVKNLQMKINSVYPKDRIAILRKAFEKQDQLEFYEIKQLQSLTGLSWYRIKIWWDRATEDLIRGKPVARNVPLKNSIKQPTLDLNLTSSENKIKRGRGRPKKIQTKLPVSESKIPKLLSTVCKTSIENIQVSCPTPEKRGRGRPRKYPVSKSKILKAVYQKLKQNIQKTTPLEYVEPEPPSEKIPLEHWKKISFRPSRSFLQERTNELDQCVMPLELESTEKEIPTPKTTETDPIEVVVEYIEVPLPSEKTISWSMEEENTQDPLSLDLEVLEDIEKPLDLSLNSINGVLSDSFVKAWLKATDGIFEDSQNVALISIKQEPNKVEEFEGKFDNSGEKIWKNFEDQVSSVNLNFEHLISAFIYKNPYDIIQETKILNEIWRVDPFDKSQEDVLTDIQLQMMNRLFMKYKADEQWAQVIVRFHVDGVFRIWYYLFVHCFLEGHIVEQFLDICHWKHEVLQPTPNPAPKWHIPSILLTDF